MIEISKYDIYGTIDHEYKGKNVRLVGKVLEINEGDRTCKMQFENNLCEDGIPMESVSIDEGVFDKIKDSFGSGLSDIKNSVKNITKYAKNVFRKVGGLVRTVYHGKILPVLNNVMMGQYAAAGALNKDITLYLPQETKEIAKVNDVVVKDQYGINYDYQLKEQNEFLKTVIEKYKKSFPEQSKPTMEGLKTVYLNEVNERYGIKEQQRLIESQQLDNFFISKNTHPSILKKMGNALNESNKIFEAEYSEDDNPGLSASASEHTPLWNVKQIIRELSSQLEKAFNVGGAIKNDFDTELQKLLQDNNMSQEDYENLPVDKKNNFDEYVKSSAKEDNKLNSPKSSHPLLIWGAPGIGKTQITQQCIGLFNHEYGIDCMMCDVPLQSMNKDSFLLPGFKYDPVTGQKIAATALPFDTLPLYRNSYQTKDKERNELANTAANAHMTVEEYSELDAEAKKNLKDGGILFFDELLSASKEVLDIVMKLLDERRLGSQFILGSHWIMSGASNRAYDMNAGDVTAWDLRYGRRFQQVTFVPTLPDWLLWAKGYDVNLKTGEFDTQHQHSPRIEQTIIDFLSSVGEDSWYEVIKDAQNIDDAKAAKMTATPASWKFASDAMYNAARHKLHQSGMSDADVQKNVKREVYNPETGEWERHYNGLTDAERAEAVGMNIGSPSEPLAKYKNFLNFSYYFPTGLLKNIWKNGCPYPKNPKIIIPLNLDPHTGGREDMITLLTAHLFAHNIIPIKLTKENLTAYDTLTKDDIKKYIEFFKHTGSVIKYLHAYLNACPNTPPISYEQAAKVVSDFTSGIMSVTGDPTKKQAYESYHILKIYNFINNKHVAEKLKLSPSQVEEIRYSIWDIIKESNMLEYNMTLQQWGKQYHANSEEELKSIVINQMKNHLDKYNTAIFNDI